MAVTLQGLRTLIHPVEDLDAAKAWWSDFLGFGPYFDEPFYVGFDVAGYELALDPNGDTARGPVTYWGVPDAAAAVAALTSAGAAPGDEVTEVGGGIKVATVIEPGGARLGIIENPHFELADPPVADTGPGH